VRREPILARDGAPLAVCFRPYPDALHVGVGKLEDREVLKKTRRQKSGGERQRQDKTNILG